MKQLFFIAVITSLLFTNYEATSQALTMQTKNTKKPIKPESMELQKSYTASISVDKSPEFAFNAIKNFRAWWSEEIEGPTDKLNEVFVYHYKDVHISKMKLIESIPGKRLVYEVLDNQFSFTKDKSEWIGTKLAFDISAEDGKTKIKFTHEGLVPDYECYKVCYDAWGNYITVSLHALITTGHGKPNPKDKDGFNAELADKWKIKH